LDARESREFDRLVRDFRRSGCRSVPHGGVRRRAGTPLRWTQALGIVATAASFAVTSALLPPPLNLWSPVALLCVVAATCVVWGCRTERRRDDGNDL
jgi:hypothetical protein